MISEHLTRFKNLKNSEIFRKKSKKFSFTPLNDCHFFIKIMFFRKKQKKCHDFRTFDTIQKSQKFGNFWGKIKKV